MYRFALGAALCFSGLAPAAPAAAAPYSSHSQIYSCCTDPAVMEAKFREAKASGAAFIRLDINVPSIIAPDRYPHLGPDGVVAPALPVGVGPGGVVDPGGVDPGGVVLPTIGPTGLPRAGAAASSGRAWGGLDLVAELSRRYRLPVLGILLGSPNPADSCPARIDRRQLCPPADPSVWASYAAEIAARYRGVIDHFEVWNEPDGPWAFAGGPEDYARMLSAAYDAIKAEAPSASVILGGTMYPTGRGGAWLSRVFATPGANAARKFDVGSIHVRGQIKRMLAQLRARKRFLRKTGRSVPIWITEHGYPANTKFQRSRNYRGGPRAQAAYLAEALPALALGGAAQVFVTLRDGGGGPFNTEGILRGKGRPGEAFSRKPAWFQVRRAARRWPVAAFRRRFVKTRARAQVLSRRARDGRRRVRIRILGRYRGPGCRGRLLLSVRPAHGRRQVLTARFKRGCRVRTTVVVKLPRKARGRTTMLIDQRFLGNARTGPGDARRLRVRFTARR